jgi:putative transposase
VVEVIYERAIVPAVVDPALRAGVDIGIDNLAAIASDKPGFVPRVVNGRPIKSINQFYNKRKAELQSRLGCPGTTARMQRLTTRRTRRIDHYLHTASRRIIDLLVVEGIGTLVIGKNPLWKQEVNLGRRTNQQFVAIPHARFIEMLTYKAALVSIAVVVNEESYTSKASFLDADPLPIYGAERAETHTFSGKRVKRGLYRAANGRRIHADVNGAYNILRKAVPNSFGQGIEAVVVRPMRLAA